MSFLRKNLQHRDFIVCTQHSYHDPVLQPRARHFGADELCQEITQQLDFLRRVVDVRCNPEFAKARSDDDAIGLEKRRAALGPVRVAAFGDADDVTRPARRRVKPEFLRRGRDTIRVGLEMGADAVGTPAEDEFHRLGRHRHEHRVGPTARVEGSCSSFEPRLVMASFHIHG